MKYEKDFTYPNSTMPYAHIEETDKGTFIVYERKRLVSGEVAGNSHKQVGEFSNLEEAKQAAEKLK